MNVKWTLGQKDFIRKNAQVMTDAEMAAALGKSLESLRKVRQRMGIVKKNGRPGPLDRKKEN